ncbi:putative membrane protein [Caulobacter ginsengisoli]|uniref:Membrane protein n=1 Tax=Caulobacter ginsengisoli TaxID=400775 RepID=A0ABU0IYR9_9CAUL|nr:heparan-alpha-glucosaminide N-acetyltransferase domain-containing protein [Caulobacter ginsengisoli]MDQ0466112.1 putative membrane protein [Caulobacter ginsengisoli]
MTDTVPTPVGRLTSIDLLRGLVIVIMALDHVRDYTHAASFVSDPTNPATTTLGLYLTRWVTHFCAPTFSFLAGVSVWMQARNKTKGELSRFLVTRGLWLIVLELVVENIGWNWNIPGWALIVLWSLGAGMIALAALIHLPRRAVLAIGVAIIALHDLTDGISPGSLGPLAWLWHVLHVPGPIAGNIFVIYPILPWIGIISLGYGLGDIFTLEPARRARLLLALGGAMILAFLVLRGINLYGDIRPWSAQAESWRTVLSFFNVSKYPPSLDFVLITLGPMFLLLPALERLKGAVAGILLTYGRVPLFFFILHIWLAHLLVTAAGMAMGYPFQTFVGVIADPTPMVEAHWGFGLWSAYLTWAVVLLLMYPLCRWWGHVKATRKDWWLSYL